MATQSGPHGSEIAQTTYITMKNVKRLRGKKALQIPHVAYRIYRPGRYTKEPASPFGEVTRKGWMILRF